ncbi:retrovirus-related pol polyprotein from transposon TNT 1-94 [Tanacetum coccineum]
MPILHSFEENKLEYEDEDEVEIKMIGTGMDKEFLEHNLYENDITSIICHNFSLTSNPPVRGREKTRSHLEYIARRSKLLFGTLENRRMILNSVQNGLLVWPTIFEEDGTTRTKRYKELSLVEKLQADYDLKATNIVLQGHPSDVYAIVNHPKVAKEIWDRVKLLIQGTKLSLQEKECKLYEEFDKFSFVKGEPLYHLPPEWSKFVTDVKLARDLHTTNCDQLYSYLEQHESHANETRLMRKRYQDPLAFVANLTSQAVPIFNQGDDPIACINKAMAFLTVIASLRFLSMNNQLRTSSNPRNQATIQDDRVTIQQVQGRQGQSYAGTSYKGNATSYGGNNAGGQTRVTEDLDAYDSDCDDVSNAKAILMANLFNYGSDVILEKPQRIKPTLYDGSVISSQHAASLVFDDDETLILEECFEIHKKELFLENDQLLQKIMSQDVMICVMNSTAVFDGVKLEMQSSEFCVKCLDLDAELLIKQNAYNDLSKSQIQEKVFATALQNELRKLKGKNVLGNAATITNTTSIALRMFKLDLDPLAPRITSTNVVPIKETNSHSVETQKLEIKVYSSRPKQVKSIGSSKKAKIVESKIAKHLEPNHLWGSNAADVPSSSRVNDSKFLGTVRYENDQIAKIISYGDYQLGNVIVSRVYYVEGLRHNLFSVRQFCDADLEVSFRKNTSFIWNFEGVDLLSGSRDTNLYTISLDYMLKTSPICLLSKASKSKSWLWHYQLSYLNFDTLQNLARDGVARGIPKLKFQKNHLCSACALGKSKKSSH